MSEAKAQAKALADGFLKSVGESYEQFDPSDYPVAEQMFIYYGKIFNDEIKEQLKISG